MSFTGGGTLLWMSPELLDPVRFGITDSRPTKQSDCYALGMVVYEVCENATVSPFRMFYSPALGPLWGGSFFRHESNGGRQERP